jgi:hypothetical protein
MICNERERLSIEYRNAVQTLTERSLALRTAKGPASIDKNTTVELALSASADARTALRKHMDEHQCWTHSASSLLQLWQSPGPGADRNAKATAR